MLDRFAPVRFVNDEGGPHACARSLAELYPIFGKFCYGLYVATLDHRHYSLQLISSSVVTITCTDNT